MDRTQSRESGTVLVLVIVLEKLKADYENEHAYEYDKTICLINACNRTSICPHKQ